VKGWFLTGLLAFLLTACAPTVAHYRHPEAGTVVTCERWPARSDSQRRSGSTAPPSARLICVQLFQGANGTGPR